jgi:LmeA-like phospholipid-binding
MRFLRRLLILFLILAVLTGAADWLLTTWAEGAMERRLKDEVGGSAHVEIDSWPVVTRALLSENIDRLSVDLRQVEIEGTEVDHIYIELNGIAVSPGRIFRRQFDEGSIDQGSVVVDMTLSDLAAAAGVPPENLSGTGEISVQDGRVIVDGQDVAAVPQDVLPCPADAEINGDEIEFRCSLDSVPEIVLRNLPR